MDLHEKIAVVAYELFERDGSQHGKDTEHWLEAERIVLAGHAAGEEKAGTRQTEKTPLPKEESTGTAPTGRKKQARPEGEPPSPAGGRGKKVPAGGRVK
ncbi:MAG: DUF2934 domain-containing protein [Syntrophorhabdales bacterium]|jgi:hypothetical protein